MVELGVLARQTTMPGFLGVAVAAAQDGSQSSLDADTDLRSRTTVLEDYWPAKLSPGSYWSKYGERRTSKRAGAVRLEPRCELPLAGREWAGKSASDLCRDGEAVGSRSLRWARCIAGP